MKFDPMKPAPPVTRIASPIIFRAPSQRRNRAVPRNSYAPRRLREPLIVIEKPESPNSGSRGGEISTKPRGRYRPAASESLSRQQGAPPAELELARRRGSRSRPAQRPAIPSFPDTSARSLVQS